MVLLSCEERFSAYPLGVQPFEIFSAARLRDFPTLLAATRQCRTLWKPERLVVAVPAQDQKAVQAGLGPGVSVVDENSLLRGFDRRKFQARPIAHFPRSFGWYLQQFLKIEYCRQTNAEHCLVWDADTVPLEKLQFLDERGRIYLTKAEEYHKPYFFTIEKLFGVRAAAESSFVSQHMFVKCEFMRSMCRMIEERFDVGHWTDALGSVLESHPDRANLFSEYETYANYLLLFERESVVVRDLKWDRCESARTWSPPQSELEEARAAGLSFAAYESKDALWSRLLLKSLEKAPQLIKCAAVTFVLRRSGAGHRRAEV
jgi:hypothetical protein